MCSKKLKAATIDALSKLIVNPPNELKYKDIHIILQDCDIPIVEKDSKIDKLSASLKNVQNNEKSPQKIFDFLENVMSPPRYAMLGDHIFKTKLNQLNEILSYDDLSFNDRGKIEQKNIVNGNESKDNKQQNNTANLKLDQDNSGEPNKINTTNENTKKENIFIIHGHDGAKHHLASVIKDFGLRPLILDDLPDKEKVIIDKFEYYASRTDYAIAILTPDDVFTLEAGGEKNVKRARQNIIFEIGYFYGLKGKKNVSILYKEGVELPSDLHGILYIPMDENGGWILKLLNNLKSAGFDIDANKLYSN